MQFLQKCTHFMHKSYISAESVHLSAEFLYFCNFCRGVHLSAEGCTFLQRGAPFCRGVHLSAEILIFLQKVCTSLQKLQKGKAEG